MRSSFKRSSAASMVLAVLTVVVLVAVLLVQHSPSTEARWYAATTLGEQPLRTDVLKVDAVDLVDGAWAVLDSQPGDTATAPANPATWKLTNQATTGDMVVDLISLDTKPLAEIRSSQEWIQSGKTQFELTIRADNGPDTCARRTAPNALARTSFKGSAQSVVLGQNVKVTLPPGGAAWVCVHLTEMAGHSFGDTRDRVKFVANFAGTGVAMNLGYTYQLPNYAELKNQGLEWEGAGSVTSHVMASIPWIGRDKQYEWNPGELCGQYFSYIRLHFGWPTGYTVHPEPALWSVSVFFRDPAKPDAPWALLAGKTDTTSSEDRLQGGGMDGKARLERRAGQPWDVRDTKVHRWNAFELGSRVEDTSEIPDWNGSGDMYRLDLRLRLYLSPVADHGSAGSQEPQYWIESPYAIRLYYRDERGSFPNLNLRCKTVRLPDSEINSSYLPEPFSGARVLPADFFPEE